mmetsp:Transcript_14126/g.34842  ORF Transcript_14126/g.34842 Transcript_14126/m.34842 type:complete len:125 (+) Transcript_14126:622-996(+)
MAGPHTVLKAARTQNPSSEGDDAAMRVHQPSAWCPKQLLAAGATCQAYHPVSMHKDHRTCNHPLPPTPHGDKLMFGAVAQHSGACLPLPHQALSPSSLSSSYQPVYCTHPPIITAARASYVLRP